MTDEEALKRNFQENLKAVEYHEMFMNFFSMFQIYTEIGLSFIYDVLKSGRFKGKKLLEIGSGPTYHNVASASDFFHIIVLSDFVDDNVQNLKLWHKGESPLDWSKVLDIVSELEDFKSDAQEARAKLESRIRNSVKAIVHSDILMDGVLNLEEIPAEASPPYDLIISIQTLEIPCADLKSFINALKRVNKLLRRGGGLIIGRVYNCDGWAVKGRRFPSLKIDLKEVVAALDEAGFGKHDVRRFAPVKTDYMEYDGFYMIATEAL